MNDELKEVPKGTSVYKNPHNGYEESVDLGDIFLAILFGPLYFAAKGVWGWAIIMSTFSSFLLLVPFYQTALMAVIPYILIGFSAGNILNVHYQRLGWKKVQE